MAKLVGLKDQYQLAFGTTPIPTGTDRDAEHGADESHHYCGRHPVPVQQSRLAGARRSGKDVGLVGADRSRGAEDRSDAARGASRVQVVRTGCSTARSASAARRARAPRSCGATVGLVHRQGRIIMDLLARRCSAGRARIPACISRAVGRAGRPVYTRIDAPATPAQKSALKKLSPEAVRASTLAGERITAKLTRAPGNGAEIGGLKVVAENGWFAARPSGTEDVYKIYAESFRDEAHLKSILDEAKVIVAAALQ